MRLLHTLSLTASCAFAFSAKAQSPCDSLEIISVRYAPFTDTALDVTVFNHATELFGYPMFNLVDADGDTLARESMNFFGIGWGAPQVHRMDLVPGAELPGSPFIGTLVLFYSAWPEPEGPCVWPMTFDLCPDQACTTMEPYIVNLGNALVTADLSWTIADMDGNTFGSGTWHLDASGQQQDNDSVCLPPGEYHLIATNPDVTGGQLRFGVTQGIFASNGPSDLYIPGGTQNVLPFAYYEACAEGTNAIGEASGAPFTAVLDDQVLRIRSTNGEALGTIEVLDVNGRLVQRKQVNAPQAALDLSAQAMGTYLVRVQAADQVHVQRVVLVR